MKRILILGASEFQIPVVKKAKELECYVGAIDINPFAPALKYADISYQCSIKDKEAVLRIAMEFNPDAVTVGICDSAMNTAAYVCAVLNLPFQNTLVADTATNKYKMIQAFEKNGVAHPKYQLIRKNEIEHANITLPFPVICKPLDTAGSKGINLIQNAEDQKAALQNSSMIGSIGDVLVEEMLVGPEVSVEVVVLDDQPMVIQITDKMTTGAPHFIEIGHSQPSTLCEDTKNAIKMLAISAAKAINLKNCVAHAEIIVTDQGPKMVEIGGRLGGDGIAEQLVELSTGISMTEIAIKQAFGEKIDTDFHRKEQGSAIRFIQSRKGTVKSIDGIEKTKNSPHVFQAEVICREADSFSDTVDNTGRAGYVIASADDARQAAFYCENAIKELKIEIK